MADDRRSRSSWYTTCIEHLPSLRDAIASLIAVSIVAYVGLVLWGPLTSEAPDAMQRAQAIAAILGPILGTVLGYYYGASSGERVARAATQEAEHANESRVQTEDLADERLATYADQIDEVLQIVRPLLVQRTSGGNNNNDNDTGENMHADESTPGGR
jgi:hypothetical protein